jgi:prevent-host-death family protein
MPESQDDPAGEAPMPLTVTTNEAKKSLSQLLERARRGERVIITKRGVPIAELTSAAVEKHPPLSDVAAELKEIRRRTKPGTESIQSMVQEGRRF